ncbi:MAG: hypothetical protein NVS1B14_01110 [Vulcanimicrobiaceae bacterium]
MRTSQRGFTLVEVLVATAILAMVSGALVMLLHALAARIRTFAAQGEARAGLQQLLDRWEADEASAQAIFIPGVDVFGADNLGAPHELDFYTKDSANRPYFWAYRWDAGTHRLQRYVYGGVGTAPQTDGTPIAGIMRFSVSLHRLSEITDPDSPVYLPLFQNPKDADVILDAGPGVLGGTRLVHVDFATARDAVRTDLTAHAAPSGFTVVLAYTPAPTATPASSCARINQRCTFLSPFRTPLAECSGIGNTAGYLNPGVFQLVQGAAIGTLRDNSDGTALLTRTGLGTIVVEVRATWIPNFKTTSCTPIAPLLRRYDWTVL